AVVPAGAREGAGLRTLSFVEAVAEADLANGSPALTPKQRAALEQLRSEGQPVDLRRLMRPARCGPGPIEALVRLGLARRMRRQVDQFTDTSLEAHEVEPAVTLNADQLAAWAPLELALRQGGFHAFLLHGVTGSGKTELYLRAIEEVV